MMPLEKIKALIESRRALFTSLAMGAILIGAPALGFSWHVTLSTAVTVGSWVIGDSIRNTERKGP